MKRLRIILFAPVFFLCGCFIDPFGFFVSYDSAESRFEVSRTLNQPNDLSLSGEFSFLVIADVHIYGRENSNFARLSNALLPSDRFMLVAGDLAQRGDPADYEILHSQLSNLGLPFYTVPGNHDCYYSHADEYMEFCGPTSYAFRAGELCLIALDSATGSLGKSQMEWLQGLLATNSATQTVVFTHQNLINPSFGQMQQIDGEEERLLLFDLFADSQVDIVFTGHTHQFDSNVIRGVLYYNVEDFLDTSACKVARVLVQSNGLQVHSFALE